jgi:hypothetical protein
MMENARRVVSSDPAPPSKSIAGESKNTAGKPKRGEHKRKRLEKGEQRVELEPRNTRRVKFRPTTKQGSKRVDASTAATTTASAAKTSSKKHTEQKGKKAGAATEQQVLGNLNRRQGQGEGGEKHSSQYRGVYWFKRDNTWVATIRYDGKRRYLGRFEDEEEAARAYDRAARAHNGEKAQLNFPTKKEQAAEEAKQQRWTKCGEAPSKYRGVSWSKNNNKWTAAIICDGKGHYLGRFEDEKAAARAYDRAARAQHRERAQLNFPAEGESGTRRSSKYRGVSWSKSNSKWRANIRFDGKKHHLGCFEDEDEAARAYDRAAKVHKGGRAQLNLPAKQRN